MAKFQKAADMGHHEAEANLGAFYENGLVGYPEAELAKQWYTKAAVAGHDGAQTSLGCILYREQLFEQAVYWFKLAIKAVRYFT